MPDTTPSDPEGSMKAILLDLAELKGKVGMLPGWGGLFAFAAVIITATALMILIIPPAA